MATRLYLILALTVLCLSSAYCQDEDETPSNLEEILTPTMFPNTNTIFNLLFPLSIITVQTPIAIRYVLLVTVALYDSAMVCTPKSLTFLGTREDIPRRFCESGLSQALISSHLSYRLLISEYPIEGRPYGRFLIENGLDPFDDSRDTETEIGWANVHADKLLKHFKNDGWNSQGELSKEDYRLQYQDYTGYKPENNAQLKSSKLRKPLRWQPLISQIDRHGFFAVQEHITPQIAVNVKPLCLSEDEFSSRKAPPLYSSPDLPQRISRKDKKLARKLVEDLFERSRQTTKKKIVNAFYWENKFISLGSFVSFYEDLLKFDGAINLQILMAEVMSQYDALLVAWKEKRRHDLVRTTTLIRRVLKGQQVKAFKNLDEGVGTINAEEWLPIVQIQPHSEYPSASALICTASFEHLKLALEELVLKGNATIPAYETELPPTFFPSSPVQDTMTIRFETLEEAARSCGVSRLDSGVHFGPSVPVGEKLARGIGRSAFEHVKDLIAGRRPKNCARCL